MPSYNRVILIGRLTREPELRYTTNGLAVASFSLAVDRRSKNAQGDRQTDFFRCKAWRQTAEFVNSYAHKGRLIAVDGRIELNEAVGQDGQKRYFTDIVCDTVELLEWDRQGGQSAGGEMPAEPRYGGQGAPAPAPAPAPAATMPPAAPAATGGPAPSGPAPAGVAYPENDFDDSDPFGDE